MIEVRPSRTNPIIHVLKEITGFKVYQQSERHVNFPNGNLLGEKGYRTVSSALHALFPASISIFSREASNNPINLSPTTVFVAILLDVGFTAGAIAFAMNGEWTPALGKSAWNVIAGSLIVNAERKEIKKPTTPPQLT